MNWPGNLTDPSYGQMVLDSIAAKNFEHYWVELPVGPVTLLVSSDALKIDGVRVNVSATLQQQIADALGAMLMTPKIADLAYGARTGTLVPSPAPIASTSAAMVAHSQRVDAQANKLGLQASTSDLLETVGKHWIIDDDVLSHPGKATNYGWMLPGGTKSPWQGIAVYPSVTGQAMVIQQPSWAHDVSHLDYSQICKLVYRACLVNGQSDDLARVLQDPTLASLVSHSGPVKVLRQPGVPVFACPTPGVGATPGGLCPPPPWTGSFGNAPAPPSSGVWPAVACGALNVASAAAVVAAWHFRRR
jgi:hypothetical protein